jgi:hypothetical protein
MDGAHALNIVGGGFKTPLEATSSSNLMYYLLPILLIAQ